MTRLVFVVGAVLSLLATRRRRYVGRRRYTRLLCTRDTRE